MQQDASEFLSALCTKSDTVRSSVEHRLLSTIHCKTCNDTKTTERTNFIISLPLPTSIKKVVTLQDLINSTYSRWKNFEDVCDCCGGHDKLSKSDIALVKKVIVLQLSLFSVQHDRVVKNTDYKIKSIPTTKLRIGGNTYKIITAIFHHDQCLDKGHYTSMFRQNTSWINVNDSTIEKKTWPRNAKDLIFTEDELVSFFTVTIFVTIILPI